MNRATIALATLGATAVVGAVVYVMAVTVDSGPAARSFRNVSRGMEPAMLAGDLVTTRLIPADEQIHRGELVVHQFPPNPSKQFLKRVVAIPGDTVMMVAGALRVNGHVVAEPYAWHADPASDPTWHDFDWQAEYLVGPARADSVDYQPTRDNWGPLAVPPSGYFVLGDNRDNSLDSRYWGFVGRGAITRTPRRVFLSVDPATHAVRWDRFWHRLQ